MKTHFKQFAEYLEQFIDEYEEYSESELGKRAMSLKAAIGIIRFDLVKNFYLFEHFPETGYEAGNGLARVKILADQIMILLEAGDWFSKKATIELRDIAIQKGMPSDDFDNIARELKGIYKLSELKKYKQFRVNISAHYDLSVAEELIRLGKWNVEKFYADTEGLIRYSSKWIEIFAKVMVFEGRRP